MDKGFWDRVQARRKPTIAYMPRLRKWMCTHYNTAYGKFITGQGAKPQSAYNAYMRKFKWHAAGQPGRNRGRPTAIRHYV